MVNGWTDDRESHGSPVNCELRPHHGLDALTRMRPIARKQISIPEPSLQHYLRIKERDRYVRMMTDFSAFLRNEAAPEQAPEDWPSVDDCLISDSAPHTADLCEVRVS